MNKVYDVKLVSKYTGKERAGQYKVNVCRSGADKGVYTYRVSGDTWDLMNPLFVRNFTRVVVNDKVQG